MGKVAGFFKKIKEGAKKIGEGVVGAAKKVGKGVKTAGKAIYNFAADDSTHQVLSNSLARLSDKLGSGRDALKSWGQSMIDSADNNKASFWNPVDSLVHLGGKAIGYGLKGVGALTGKASDISKAGSKKLNKDALQFDFVNCYFTYGDPKFEPCPWFTKKMIEKYDLPKGKGMTFKMKGPTKFKMWVGFEYKNGRPGAGVTNGFTYNDMYYPNEKTGGKYYVSCAQAKPFNPDTMWVTLVFEPGVKVQSYFKERLPQTVGISHIFQLNKREVPIVMSESGNNFPKAQVTAVKMNTDTKLYMWNSDFNADDDTVIKNKHSSPNMRIINEKVYNEDEEPAKPSLPPITMFNDPTASFSDANSLAPLGRGTRDEPFIIE